MQAIKSNFDATDFLASRSNEEALSDLNQKLDSAINSVEYRRVSEAVRKEQRRVVRTVLPEIVGTLYLPGLYNCHNVQLNGNPLSQETIGELNHLVAVINNTGLRMKAVVDTFLTKLSRLSWLTHTEFSLIPPSLKQFHPPTIEVGNENAGHDVANVKAARSWLHEQTEDYILRSFSKTKIELPKSMRLLSADQGATARVQKKKSSAGHKKGKKKKQASKASRKPPKHK